MDTTEKPQRADARRNRERIVDAAHACFASDGADAQIDDIAARAGVGVGTVYRHFPTKELLLQELLTRKFEEMADCARESLAEPDAWDAFTRLLGRLAELQARDHALSDAMRAGPDDFRDAATRRTDFLETMSALIARAIEEGTMRPDAGPEDVPILMCGMGSIVKSHPAAWPRFLDLLLDGFRAR